MLGPTLIVGYGNIDRQDDGVAWHVLVALAEKLGRQAPASPDALFSETMEQLVEGARPSADPRLLFVLQLTPELAETLSTCERVCFIDAHTGRVLEEVHVEAVAGEYQSSPFTHHMTPATLLAMVETLYGKRLVSLLVSIRGYEFGFSQALSGATEALVPAAVHAILSWSTSP